MSLWTYVKRPCTYQFVNCFQIRIFALSAQQTDISLIKTQGHGRYDNRLDI